MLARRSYLPVRRFPAALVMLAATGAVLAGCGGSDTATPPAAAPVSPSAATAPPVFGAADVAFVQAMIPHHEQAVEMAGLAPGRTTDQEVLTLATNIATAQRPEIDRLTGFLRAWDVPSSPAATAATTDPGTEGDMGGMDHGGHEMSGMMTDADVTTLGTLSGAEFDDQWLDMMIVHHEGAVEMAETERADGQNGEARALAEEIIRTQRTEIDQMAALLPPG